MPTRHVSASVLCPDRATKRGLTSASRRLVPGDVAACRQMESAQRDDEDELARLIDEVRSARERLARLIAAIKTERAGWEGREQRWARWRSQIRTPPRKPPRRGVH